MNGLFGNIKNYFYLLPIRNEATLTHCSQFKAKCHAEKLL